MNAQHLLFPVLLGGLCTASQSTNAQTFHSQPQQQHLCFVENKGQVTDQYGNSRPDINYRIAASGINMYVGSGQLHYQWAAPALSQTNSDKPQRIALYRMDVTLAGGDPQAEVVAEQKQGYHERYYTPQFGEQGATANSYQKITYQNVYPNIDWVLYVKDNAVEYDFVVRPGGKVSDIKLQYSGATDLSIDKAGRLTAITPMGSITEQAPVSFQADGKRIVSAFVLKDNTLSFSASDYTGTLVIDPTLSWSTYYGGNNDETIRYGCVTGDKYGNAYLCGVTQSTANIATTGGHQDTLAGSTDAFLTKFDKTGSLLWATYYGGSDADNAQAVTCDTTGAVYLSGHTYSTTSIATSGAYQTSLSGSSDAFLAKFDTGGVRQYATYFGGTETEECYGVKCDPSGNVYITGQTQSTTGIATTGAYQTTLNGSTEAYLAKFSNTGTRLWSTYFGGTLQDYGYGIACDQYNNAYLCGYTKSTASIATTGSHQSTHGGQNDAFLAKFDSSGVEQWATYTGGTLNDAGYGVACDGTGNVYTVGSTRSTTNISTTGSIQDTYGGGSGDGFIEKFNASGVRQWGTYYGGSGADETTGITMGQSGGTLYLSGNTASTTGIATSGALQDTINGLRDAFLVKIDTSGTRSWATYHGGDDGDWAYGVFCNDQSQVFVGGQTTSFLQLATTGSYQSSFGGGTTDGFMTRIDDCGMMQPDSISGIDTACRGISYTYKVPAVTGALSYTWVLPTGWTGSSTTDSIVVTTGSGSDTIRVMANFPCGASSETVKSVHVNPAPTITPAGTISTCDGDSVTLSASTGISYQWMLNNVAISTATSSGYTAHTAGYYTVAVSSALGCSDTSSIDTLVIHPLPVPVITASGMVLSTGTYASYQWNHDNVAIIGATGGSYTVILTTGNYTVTVTDSNGCSGTSAPFNAASLGMDNSIGKSNPVRLYPNPASDYLYIESSEKVNVTICSIEGRVIGYYPDAKRIDLRPLAAGMYIARITDRNGTVISNTKVIKHTNR